MDVLLLSRVQFAVATLFHFIFVPFTLGLGVLVATMETLYVRSGNGDWLRLTKFWGKIFVINFVLGVVTGLTLEFQFGTNWAGYSVFVGDVFGSLLAIEATATFFLESILLGVWIFGWRKISPGAHAAVMWLIVLASIGSAYWILAANAFMQHPVGYVMRDGRAELESFLAVVTQKFAVITFLHVIAASFLVGGFFVTGVSAYHVTKGHNVGVFKKSFKIGAIFSLVFALFAVFTGHLSGEEVAAEQPAKMAAMESHWETVEGAPLYLLAFPDEDKARNHFEIIKIPAGLSLLAHFDPKAEVRGLRDFPVDERPPVAVTFLSFRAMVGLGFLLVPIAATGFMVRNRVESAPPWLLWGFLAAIPLPYIATELGWIVTEVGRQPWIVYGVMKTSEGVSGNISPSQVSASLAALSLLYGLLALVDFYLIYHFAGKGLEDAVKGRATGVNENA